ncbi:hypothetical protein GCM10010123_32760 [Pilimelia anulata]|uniref:Carboxypeptidase regulatory-like domain-containing protein n=1 Tax=Pilimelia anulata TaxID=53371 RepID=A0A8J3B7N7_9ACTN|nr:carboxypeptidase-like regulatory domain-containing protein [Pilimelia anulata]GGK00288.1 hypothetical protein GCM10010123_32760 [Pilimelia anulata]
MRRLLLTALVAVPAAVAATAPATAGPATGTLTGVLTLAATGRPAAGACAAALPRWTDDTTPAARTCVGADGRYTLRVPPGQYALRADGTGLPEQWHGPSGTAGDRATLTVGTGGRAVADLALVPGFATIAGRVTDPDGAPAAAGVSVYTENGTAIATDAGEDGRYALRVRPGAYRMSAWTPEFEHQYRPGRSRLADARAYRVAAGGALTLDERFLDRGSVRATFVDRATGAAVPDACLSVGALRACADARGVATLDRAPSGGPRAFAVEGGVGHRGPELTIDVRPGKRADRRVPLDRVGAIVVNAVQAGTRRPAAGVCVLALRPGENPPYTAPLQPADRTARAGDRAANGAGERPAGVGRGVRFGARGVGVDGPCTDGNGTLTLGPYPAGATVHLLAGAGICDDDDCPDHGLQWVGRSAGTGDRRGAAALTVRPDAWLTAPTISITRSGAIEGTVLGAGGEVVRPVCAFPFAIERSFFGSGPRERQCTDEEGRYGIEGLGPFAWPVLFTAPAPYAWQWSGGQPDRFAAAYRRVPLGGVVGQDATLTGGGTVRGTPGYTAAGVMVRAYSARTGDLAAERVDELDADGRYTIRATGGQQLKVVAGNRCWYPAATDAGAATAVPVTEGKATENVDVRCAGDNQRS